MQDSAQNSHKKNSALDELRYIIGDHKLELKQFLVFLLVVAVIFAMSFPIIINFNLILYIEVILSVALVVFVMKRVIAYFCEVKLLDKIWLSGLIISAIATLFLSTLAGVPLLVPVLRTSDYERQKTLAGLKMGDVNVHEKWKISMFSSMAFFTFGILFLFLNNIYNLQPLFGAGSFLLIYTFLNLLPYERFDGAFLAYHNTILYFVVVLMALLTVILALLSYFAGIIMLIVFVGFGLVTQRLKLW